jgi:group I intron endonuclease
MNVKQLKNLPGVYVLKCMANGKHYVGETMNVRSRILTHLRSKQQLIHKAFEKHGIDTFEIYVEYLSDFSKEDLIDLEENLIYKLDALVPNGYNICKRGINAIGRVCSEETKRKISDKAKGRIVSEETKIKLRGKIASAETRAKMSASWKTMDKVSGRKGKTNSPEMRAKQSASSKGHKKSEITKARMKQSWVNRKLSHSQESSITLIPE